MFVGFDCRISPLGLNILDNGRENVPCQRPLLAGKKK